MSASLVNQANAIQQAEVCFDLFRLSKAKEVVDLCSNTLREYNSQGLPFYRRGKVVFVSRSELANFIRSKPQPSRKGASNASN